MSSDAENQIILQTQLRESQNKFVYYFIGLSVAAIGFAVSKTIDTKLECFHLPLGLAVLSWSLCIFCGFNFVVQFQKGLSANDFYFSFIRGHIGKDITPSELVNEVAGENLKEVIRPISRKSTRFYKWMQFCFYAGIAFFIAWHIFMMAYIYK